MTVSMLMRANQEQLNGRRITLKPGYLPDSTYIKKLIFYLDLPRAGVYLRGVGQAGGYRVYAEIGEEQALDEQ